jgi:hypothetical protein
MVGYKHNPRMMNPLHREARRVRLSLLSNFPPTSPVKWKYSDDILTVVGHDEDLGRVKTSNGMSYNPDELELFEVKK